MGFNDPDLRFREDQGLGIGAYRFRHEFIEVPGLDYQGSRSILVKKHSRYFQCGFLWFFGSLMLSSPISGWIAWSLWVLLQAVLGEALQGLPGVHGPRKYALLVGLILVMG